MASIAYKNVTTSGFTFYLTGLDASYNQATRTAHWEVKEFLTSAPLYYNSDETLANQITTGSDQTVSGLADDTVYVVTCHISNTSGTINVDVDPITVTTDEDVNPNTPHQPEITCTPTDTTITVVFTAYQGDTLSASHPFLAQLLDSVYQVVETSFVQTDTHVFQNLTPGTNYRVRGYAIGTDDSQSTPIVETVRTTGGSSGSGVYVFTGNQWKPGTVNVQNN